VVDVALVSEAVAGVLAAGGVKELGETVGGGLTAGIIDRVRKVFGADARSVDALERTREGEPGAVAELASALAWYARRDQAFAQELAAWAAQAGGGVTQHVHAGRDAYVAGRDQTITNYRRPGELDRLCSRPRTVTPGQASAPIPVMIASPSPTRLPRAWSRRRFSSPTSS
jgi:hypothetical protein